MMVMSSRLIAGMPSTGSVPSGITRGETASGCGAGDVATFTRAAHTIKGSSANVGAQVLRGVAERLARTARTEGLGAVAPLIAECEAQYVLAAAELARLAK